MVRVVGDGGTQTMTNYTDVDDNLQVDEGLIVEGEDLVEGDLMSMDEKNLVEGDLMSMDEKKARKSYLNALVGNNPRV